MIKSKKEKIIISPQHPFLRETNTKKSIYIKNHSLISLAKNYFTLHQPHGEKQKKKKKNNNSLFSYREKQKNTMIITLDSLIQ